MEQKSAYIPINNDPFRSFNFKNKQHIFTTFNRSVFYYKQYRKSIASGDEETAAYQMLQAGTLLYDVCEWGFKNYLYNFYENEKLCGKISEHTCKENQRFVRVIDNREVPMRLYDLARIMINIEREAVKRAEFSAQSIFNNSQEVNNDPKHNGCIPNANAYEAVLPEARKLLSVFVDTEGDANLARIEDGDSGEWEEFIIGCDYFIPNGSYSYILVTDSLPNDPNLDAIFYVDWDLVLDFDSATNMDGGLAQRYAAVQKKYPHLLSLDFNSTLRSFELSSMPYWIMLNGDASDPHSLIESDHDLRKHNIKYLYGLLNKFHNSYAKPAKVVIATCSNYPKSVLEVIRKLNESYDYNDAISFYALSCGCDFGGFNEDNFSKQPLTIPGLLENLKNNFSSNLQSFEGKITVPSENNSQKEISYDLYSAMFNSMELLYLGIENVEDGKPENFSPRDFYYGSSSISWYCLQNSFDVRRSQENDIIEKIKQELVLGRPPIKQVLYEPGLGGTSFMRRAAFTLHTQYPTVIVRKISEDTGEYLKKLYDISKLPLAIFVDSNDLTSDQVIQLHAAVKPFFSFAIIYFCRWNGERIPRNVIGQLIRLNPSECKNMVDLLQPYITDELCNSNLKTICAKNPFDMDHTPFILAMYGLDKEFKGTKNYIAHFLQNMTQEHKNTICYIALANFVDTNIDEQFFVDFNESTNLRFMTEPGTPFFSLIKRVTDQSNKKNYFEMRHYLFGQEVLYQLSDNENSTRIKFSGLLDYIKRFIRSSRKSPYLRNDQTIKLLNKLFIKREEDEDSTIATYAPLIEKLREEHKGYLNDSYDETQDIILSIFNELVTVYPDVPHFIAHMARYYFYNDDNYEKGFAKINEAINISKNEQEGDMADPTLYHMKAMGYSALITQRHRVQLIQALINDNLDAFNSLIYEIEADSENAFDLFNLTRQRNAKGIAAYIADINLCITLIQTGQRIQEICAERHLDNIVGPDWYRKYLDRAQTLLEICKPISAEQESQTFDESRRINEVERKLHILEGNIEETIAICKEYLKDENVHNKPEYRRILARTYKKQTDNSSESIKSEENQNRIIEIVRLMEENIREEPKKSGNIRIWFNAIRRLSANNPEIVMLEALDNLNSWLAECPDSIEAHFYRFIIKFIQMTEDSLIAQDSMNTLLNEMRSHTKNLSNRTITSEWLGVDGNGLERLISASDFWRQRNSDEELNAKLYKLKGQLPSKESFYGKTAYLYYKRNEIYFKPSALHDIGPSNERQWVEFGVGFSYDGPRAFNNSICLLAPGAETESYHRQELVAGDVVTCEVTSNSDKFTDVLIRGTGGQTGSIYYTNLSEEYSRDKRPREGSTIKAKLLNRREFKGKMRWMLTMNMNIGKNATVIDNPMASQLRKWLEQNKRD